MQKPDYNKLCVFLFPAWTYVAFSASATNQQGVGQSRKYIFDNVITNHGNGYETSIYEFTCPISGLYMFTHSLMSAPGYNCWARPFGDGIVGPNSFADGSTGYAG